MSAHMAASAAAPGHRHEALLYRGEDELVAGTVPFLREGVAAGDAVLAAVSASRYDALCDQLGEDAAHVEFLDIRAVGRNPGRMISRWHDFVTAHSGRRVRGIGEPVWDDRTADELAECHRLEALWNLAFADHDLWVLCPYDVEGLPAGVLDDVRRTHPVVVSAGRPRPSEDFADPGAIALTGRLPEPPDVLATLPFSSLPPVRAAVATAAMAAGAHLRRRDELVLAVSEIAGNSLRHGGGSGRLRIWHDESALVCEIRDAGRIQDPLVGRFRPATGQVGGRGVWIAQQLCDLVQIRSGSEGTTVRLHVRLASEPDEPARV